MNGLIVVNKDRVPFFCANPDDIILKKWDNVVFSTPDGYDYGTVRYVDVEVKDYKEKSYKILRLANIDDDNTFKEIVELEKESYDIFNDLVKDNMLDMKLVKIDYRFDKQKITFFFVAEHRVDFRQLVRDLATKYKKRIELRQIGVRDQAKIVDGYGICGRRQCCSGYLNDFETIDTNMAKVQDLMINPDKISGNCGRLLCCLAYEKDFYISEKKNYPEIGSIYKDKEHGNGVVKSINIFKSTMMVQFDDSRWEEIYFSKGDKKNG